MTNPIFAYILHNDGISDDTASELIVAAKKIDPESSVTAVVCGSGQGIDAVCSDMASVYQEVWKIDDESLSYPNAEVIRELLCNILPGDAIVLIPHEHFGMDLSSGLSVKLDAAYLPDAIDFDGIENGGLKAVRQGYNGQVSNHVACDISQGAVISVRPGAFQPEESKAGGGQIVDKTSDAMEETPGKGRRRFIEIVEAEMGDVDITRSDILVSVGRGIEDEDNLDIIHALAEAVGGDVSCSRPIVDSNWLEKARQVGSSGQTVKPKVYMALGISGSFQHLAGLKGNPFIVAVNKNPKALIFQVADIGVVADMLEFIPELTSKINEGA
jgi:electron transfer flavoprotein alpha subunit